MSFWLSRPGVRGRLRQWLVAPNSLSEHLRAASRHDFHVRPLSQGIRHAIPQERHALHLPAHSPVLVREVLLMCDGQPVVFARSLVAARHLSGPWQSLQGLGARPLATVLFSDPRIARGALEFCRIDQRHLLHRQASACVPDLPPSLWVRRSVFQRGSAPLLVTEVFLPAVLKL